ncbi:TrkA C-terminal domain-containing protein [Haloferacaceae archaeon DSL9]
MTGAFDAPGSPGVPLDASAASIVFQAAPVVDDPARAVATISAYALLAFLGSAVTAVLFRWYAREAVPDGVSSIVGVSIVALYLNTVASLNSLISGAGSELLELEVVLFNVAALVVAVLATPVGRRVGDRMATDFIAVAGGTELDRDVSAVVQTVGRVTAITLPEEIDDMEGYDPVAAETKAELAGKTLLFPRRLTVARVRERLVDRLTEDYGVGYVDVEITTDGTVAYLAVGSRAAGVGPTLAPGTVAVAVRADPAAEATPGDTVQLWRDGESPSRVVSGELRAATDDVATVAIDESDVAKLDPNASYRLVTLPATPRYDREFASLLRAATETMAAVTVDEGAALIGRRAAALDVVVVAVRRKDASVAPAPTREWTLEAGETIFALGRPDALRRVEADATAPDETRGGAACDPPSEGR